jgi:DNA-directed RNA polymerase subunit RPC12/RpoP|tara:strand:- start:30 stop:197 length:168 start_codon:yes stop_codon:yes gene_type:complete
MAEIETVTPKGEDLVGYCAICGVEFDSKISTNRYVKCDSCESIFQVRVKTEVVEE